MTTEHKNSIPFIWDDEKVKCFGNYIRKCAETKWCSCVQCFKERYIKAQSKIIKEAFSETSDYYMAIVNVMEY